MAYISNASPMPFNSTRTRATFDFSFARASAGSSNAARMPMIAMTTKSSINENALLAFIAHCTRCRRKNLCVPLGVNTTVF